MHIVLNFNRHNFPRNNTLSPSLPSLVRMIIHFKICVAKLLSSIGQPIYVADMRSALQDQAAWLVWRICVRTSLDCLAGRPQKPESKQLLSSHWCKGLDSLGGRECSVSCQEALLWKRRCNRCRLFQAISRLFTNHSSYFVFLNHRMLSGII